MERKTLRIFCNSNCNNNCVMCSVQGSAYSYPPLNEIKANIKKAKSRDYSKISLIGGEPTIRKDIAKIIHHANSLGFYVHLSSNCRMLSYNSYLRKLIKAGLNGVSASLYGHNQRLHESITRTPGTFFQTVKGIDNIIKNKIKLDVNVVIIKQNLPYLGRTISFLKNRGVTNIHLINISPIGNAENLKFNPKLDDLRREFTELNLKSNSVKIVLFDFPYCILEKKYHNLIFSVRTDKTDVIWNRHKSSNKINYENLKIKPRKCLNCKFSGKCGGVWKTYYEKYGSGELNTKK